MITLNRKLVKSTAIIGGTLALSIGAAYASFTSNSVTIPGNTLTTGQANIKLCDVSSGNSWSNSVSPSLNLSQVIPNEERDLLVSREVHLGNDDGHLNDNLGTGKCTSYGDPASSSNTPMRIQPNISFTSETCPDPLTTYVKLRFELNGIDTGYKTLNSWATNTTQFDPLINAGSDIGIKAIAQLSSTAPTQQGSCNFTINFAGKQPTT